MACRFVLLTDTHYHPCAPHDFAAPKMLTRGREVLEASVPAVNALQAEFIIHGGDLLCGGSSFEIPRDQYDLGLREVADAYAGFEAPIHYVPGNHDCDADEYSFEAFARAIPIPVVLNVVEAAPRLRLALANVYHAGYSGSGEWTDALDAALREADTAARDDGAALLLVLHPWVHPGLGDDGGAKGVVDNAGRLRQTLAECAAVAAAFCGHRHANRVRLHRDYVNIDTACLIGYPLGFRELILDDDGWLTCRWHTLDLPDLRQASAERCETQQLHVWAGELGDRETTVLLPRARELWR